MAVSIYTFERFRKGECNSNKGNWTNWANWREKIASSFGNNSVILRISYVYVTYILRISYVINKEMIRFYHTPHFHIKKRVEAMNMAVVPTLYGTTL